jgi:DNA repair exonuclease SbcCD ATPase subunit
VNIKNLRLRGFTSHKDSIIDLPRSGVVLVTGPNGSGKSSIVEGVAYGLFGKTLRGTKPWLEPGRVDLDTFENLGVVRARDLAIIQEAKETTYETNSKAQAALEELIGPFDVWRRCSVFSSSDAASFSGASDGEWKRLLEEILGLDCFDEALEACRLDLRTAEKELHVAELSLMKSRTEEGALKHRLEDATQALDGIHREDKTALDVVLQDLKVQVNKVEDELRSLRTQQTENDRAVITCMNEVSSLNQQKAVLAKESCPTCHQAISGERRATETEAVDTALLELAGQKLRLNTEGADLRASMKELESQHRNLSNESQDVNKRLAVATNSQELADKAQALKEKISRELTSASLETSTGELMLAKGREKAALLKSVEQVLGLKGVRSVVLGKSLAGIEEATNYWLSKFNKPMSITLSPYTEKKTGGSSDAISLSVEGAGGGAGYRGCSGGERRRIDLALLLALAQVAAAAHGQKDGTLFLDEVFDALDADGLGAVGDCLAELAVDRAVVVISHSPDLVRQLRPVTHIKVDNGTCTY